MTSSRSSGTIQSKTMQSRCYLLLLLTAVPSIFFFLSEFLPITNSAWIWNHRHLDILAKYLI